MEFLLAHGAGAESDSESIRSDISESYIGSLFQRRPGSGRRKKQVPWRSPWDASVSTDYHIQYIPKESLPSRLGLVSNNSIPSSPSIQAQRPIPSPSIVATPTNSSKRKTKQDLAGPCCHCNAVSSPQWRKGPKGKPILCNACGIRFLRTRTLGKAMPKKRRVAASGSVADAVNNQPKRIKADEPATEDEELEIAGDEGAGTEDVVATDDGLEEAHSALAGVHTQLEHPHASLLPQSRLAIASSAKDNMRTATAAYEAVTDMRASLDAAHTSIDIAVGNMRTSIDTVHHSMDAMAGQVYLDEGSADQESEELEQASSLANMPSDAGMLLAAARSAAAGTSSSRGCYSHTSFLNHAAAGTHQPLAAGSRHVLLGSSSRLGHSPVLSLALALHQQQHSTHGSMQQPGSPANAETASLSGATGSPMSNASNFHFRSLDHSDYTASGSTPGSPMLVGSSSNGQIAYSSGVSSMLSAQQQQPAYPLLQQQMSFTHQHFHHHIPQQLHQQQYVQHSLHGPSPLGLQQQQQYTETHAELAIAASASQPMAAVPAMQSLPTAAAAAATGDVMQLVRQMASALGGMGPAFELLSTINANRQAAAAAGCSHV